MVDHGIAGRMWILTLVTQRAKLSSRSPTTPSSLFVCVAVCWYSPVFLRILIGGIGLGQAEQVYNMANLPLRSVQCICSIVVQYNLVASNAAFRK
jgi:hypothetical protein